jgi:hypothetical protein
LTINRLPTAFLIVGVVVTGLLSLLTRMIRD